MQSSKTSLLIQGLHKQVHDCEKVIGLQWFCEALRCSGCSGIAMSLLIVGNCNDNDRNTFISLRTSKFYFYPANSGKAFQINRGYFVQAEIDLSKKDTSFWRLDWDANCGYRQHYISRTIPISREDSIYYHSHFAVCQVLSVSKDYYIVKVGVDSLMHQDAITDTIWCRPK